MKIRLTQPLVITIPAGTLMETTSESPSGVTVSAHTTATLAPDAYEHDYLTIGGVDLIEGRRYNVTVKTSYGKRRGEPKVLRDWRFNFREMHSWSAPRLHFGKFVADGWGGARREVDIDDLISIELIEEA